MSVISASTVRLFAVMGAASLALGCGGRAYEVRLEETKKYYEFIERQNVNLARPWKEGTYGMTIRVPAQYQVMPGPALIKDPKNPKAKPVKGPDLRQPAFLGSHKLPGLVAAWKADYQVGAAGEKTTRSAPGYLYLLSNFDLFTDPDAPKDAVEKFHGFAVQELCEGLRASPPPTTKWVAEKHPRSENNYNAQKAYTTAQLDPLPQIDGVPYNVNLYLQTTGKVHAVLISLLPAGTNPPPKRHLNDASLVERFSMALETFVNEGTPPRKTGTGGPGLPGQGQPGQSQPGQAQSGVFPQGQPGGAAPAGTP